MSYLSDAELTVMRAELFTTLPDSGHLESLSVSSDGEGGVSESWGTVTWTPSRTITADLPNGTAGTVLKYRLDPLEMRSQIEMAASAEAREIHYILVVEWDAPLAAGTVTRFVDKSNRAFNVRRFSPDNTWPICKRCMVAEVV